MEPRHKQAKRDVPIKLDGRVHGADYDDHSRPPTSWRRGEALPMDSPGAGGQVGD